MTFVQTTIKLLIAHCGVSAGAVTRPVILFGIVRNLSGLWKAERILFGFIVAGEVSASIVNGNVPEENVAVPDNVGEVPGSQASQSVLGEGVVAAPVVEEVLASSQAPSKTSRGDMDLDSLDLQRNELDEVG